MTNTKEEAVEYINKVITQVESDMDHGSPSYVNEENMLAELHNILNMVQNIEVGQEVKTEKFINDSLSILDDVFDKIKKEDQNE